jgi:hypothetical protein
MSLSRRDLVKLIAAAPFAPLGFAKINSKIEGVMVGAQTYSFRDRDLEACVAAMKEIGLSYAELSEGHLEPSDKNDPKHDADLKKAWRTPNWRLDSRLRKFLAPTKLRLPRTWIPRRESILWRRNTKSM